MASRHAVARSRSHIWKSVTFRPCGDTALVTDPVGGIPELPSDFEALAARFRRRRLGHTIVWRAVTASTMDDARALAGAGASHGTVIGADAQSAGRGRHGRAWVSRPGDDLLVSVIMRQTDPAAAARLSMLAGLTAVRAIDSLAGVRSTIKWPNDVRVDGRKVCGVLIEGAIEGRSVASVVGYGVNVNMDPRRWDTISSTATSLASILGQSQSRVRALAVLLEEMNRLEGLKDGALKDEWATRVDTVGRVVEVVTGGEVVKGVAEGIDYDGSLLVRCSDGSTRKFSAGEVTLQAPR